MKSSLLLVVSVWIVCILTACGSGASGGNSGGGGGGPQLTATHFSVTAPATASVGTAFSITVRALDASNNMVATYSGTVHFTTTDTDAQTVLAGNSMLTNGTKTFSATLMTVGGQTITATDTVAATITGSSNSIQVSTPASGVAPTGSMGTARYFHTATLLSMKFPHGGDVLVTGGVDGNNNSVASAELFDPASGTFTPTGSMAVARSSHTATLLNDGRVLVLGGGYATAELFDPANGSFTFTGSMGTARSGETATLLNDGRVLVTGGSSTGGYTATAELFDPAKGTFTPTGSMGTVRWGHTATLLNDGMVLVTGGIGSGVGNNGYLATAERFDPASGTFTPTGSMKSKRWWHRAVLLSDGRVLVTGGVDVFRTVIASAELFDPPSGTFTPTGSMANMRRIHTATLLNDGRVLITGGEYFVNMGAILSLATDELFDSAVDGFPPTASMETARAGQTATLLNDGTVLVTGGIDWTAQSATVISSADLFR
jgi:hypothetical protein